MKTIPSVRVNWNISRAFLSAAAMCGLLVQPAVAQWPNLPTAPLTIQALGDPNIVLTIDDSGSMASAAVPDNRVNDNTGRRLAARWNPLAYNPFLVYEAPYDPVALNGSKLSSSFTSAPIYGFLPSGAKEDLSTTYRSHKTFQARNGGGSYGPGNANMDNRGLTKGGITIFPIERAFFYSFYNDLGTGGVVPAPGTDPVTFTRNTAVPAGCAGPADVDNDDCYVKVTVPVDAVQEQNFANWFSFYRTRHMLTTASANLAFYDLPQNFRITWQGLTTCDNGFNRTDCQGWDGTNFSNNFRPMSNAAQRQNLFGWLSRVPHQGFTPLVQAMERAGEFYKETGINSSIANQPGLALDGPGTADTNTCRPSYHVMMTDGLWNGGASGTVANYDNASHTLPDGGTYTPQAPYKDATGGTLADLALYYWANDLQPTIADNVKKYYPGADTSFYNPRNDPANWQHMVNFTIGLGLGSFLDGQGGSPLYTPGPNPNRPSEGTYSGDFPRLASGAMAWPAATNGSDNTVSDLWHAAINSRGFFFSADSAQTMRKAFDEISSRISAAQISSGQTGNTSSRTGGGGSLAVSVSYDPSNWTSTITASKIRPDGSISVGAWSTDTSFTSNVGRSVFSWDPGSSSGFAYSWANLSSSQKTAWFKNNNDLFNWVLGDRTNESGTPPLFRKRSFLLGDVINSDLVVSGKTDLGYSSITGKLGDDYPAFVTQKKSLVYVGANDGMLHAFDANGKEVFAYVPSSLSPTIAKLAEDPYVHRNYVDGPLSLWDYYKSGWKSILVGGLGDGGKTVFGLDVTGVQSGGTFSSADVLFEINDPELGYAYSRPIVVQQPNKEWVAIFGNGYGGVSNRAMLFVYNLSTKTLTKIDTNVGTSALPNGMSSPSGLSLQTGFANAVYAGDYQGNLWRFDVDKSGTWKIANAGSPLFVAKDSGGKGQPITAAPRLLRHPAGGIMIVFGTGKFFETQDRSDLNVQTVYGIRDINAVVKRSSLVKQSIVTGNNSTAAFRAVSNNLVDYNSAAGWYLDLNSTDGVLATGEKVVSSVIRVGEVIGLNTFIPSRNTCEGIGGGYLMFLNPFTGGLSAPVSDSDGDGVLDTVAGKSTAGYKASQGSLVSPIALFTNFGDLPPGFGTSPPGSCGGPGQPVCCNPPNFLENGVCRTSQCGPGNIRVRSGGTGGVTTCVPTAKNSTWMELK
jgi:type IV pilus assembly protein PilY1